MEPADYGLEALQQRITEAKAIASRLPATTRDTVLAAFREGLLLSEEEILQANRADVQVSVGPSCCSCIFAVFICFPMRNRNEFNIA